MRVARSADERDELRGASGALELAHPEAELDVVLAVARSRPDVVRVDRGRQAAPAGAADAGHRLTRSRTYTRG